MDPKSFYWIHTETETETKTKTPSNIMDMESTSYDIYELPMYEWANVTHLSFCQQIHSYNFYALIERVDWFLHYLLIITPLSSSLLGITILMTHDD